MQDKPYSQDGLGARGSGDGGDGRSTEESGSPVWGFGSRMRGTGGPSQGKAGR